MIRQYEYPNGAFVTITTRKANHAPQIFGWATIWLSRDYFDRGICEPSTEHKNYYLCDNKKDLAAALDRFIDWLLPSARALSMLNRISEPLTIDTVRKD